MTTTWRRIIDFDKMYPGRFVKAADFNGKDVTLEISEVKLEELEGDKGAQTKGIVSFKGAKKSLVLNKTNGLCMRAMWGRETDAWIGKRVTLYPAELDGELCIRVRGSPDIADSITFELKLPRKKSVQKTLMKMVAKPAVEPPAGDAK